MTTKMITEWIYRVHESALLGKKMLPGSALFVHYIQKMETNLIKSVSCADALSMLQLRKLKREK